MPTQRSIGANGVIVVTRLPQRTTATLRAIDRQGGRRFEASSDVGERLRFQFQQPVQMVGHDDPGKGSYISTFVHFPQAEHGDRGNVGIIKPTPTVVADHRKDVGLPWNRTAPCA